MKVILYYRISDGGYSKIKPGFIGKESCLKNAIQAFPFDKVEWHVLADNVSEATKQMILNLVPEERVEFVSVGNGAGTFRLVYNKAIGDCEDDNLVYFLEDDYLHLPDALPKLIDIANSGYGEYFTLYDHPDKYSWCISVNPLVKEGGEKTTLYCTDSSHWKQTNSTTMTFASRVKTLKRDKDIFWKYTATSYPRDFDIFMELSRNNIKLLSPVPTLSTHGESAFLSPLIDWQGMYKQNIGKSNCAIVVPTHKAFSDLSQDEQKALDQIITVFKDRDLFLVIPDNITLDRYYLSNFDSIITVDSKWFTSVASYCNLCKSSKFYSHFLTYDYILIAQTDTWTFTDNLDYFCSLGFDYIGSPWYGQPGTKDGTVGNGGYSLRKVDSFFKACQQVESGSLKANGNLPEDLFFSSQNLGLKIATEGAALEFSFDDHPEYAYVRAGKRLPMGCHAYVRFGHEQFWRNFIPVEGYQTLSSF